MDTPTLRGYLERIDAGPRDPARCCVVGNAACMSMGEESCIGLNVDLAAPYSTVNEP
jgi:hypothetical protein